ncbi:hypothetical protein [Nostoc sp.]
MFCKSKKLNQSAQGFLHKFFGCNTILETYLHQIISLLESYLNSYC